MVFILAVPMIFMLALTWSLLQYNVINSDIYARVYSLEDLYYASSYELWFHDLPFKIVFVVLGILSLVFIFFALIELISFYATGARDTGKHVVVRTWAKFFITLIFWILFFIFFALYIAYFAVIIIWCILGAILNPEQFLPIAAGAGVVLAFILLMYSKLKKVNKNLADVVSDTINDVLKSSMIETLEKDQKGLMLLLDSPVDKIQQMAFNKAMNIFMDINGFPRVDKAITDEILEGDAGAIAKLLNSNIGLDFNLGIGIVGLLRGDAAVIIDCVYKLSKELNLNEDISVLIAQVAIEQLNPNKSAANKAQGAILLAFKSIFRKAFPKFQLETLDLLLQIVVEMDIKPFLTICKKLSIPQDLLQMTVAFINRDKYRLGEAAIGLTKEILPTTYHTLFSEIYRLAYGNIRGDLKQVSEILGFKYQFLLRTIIAICKDDRDMLRNTVFQAVDEIAKTAGKNDDYEGGATEEIEELNDEIDDLATKKKHSVQNYLLALSNLSTGININMITLVGDNIKELDATFAEKLYQASQGSIAGIDSLCDKLGLEYQKKLIIELCHLFLEIPYNLNEVCKRIGAQPEDSGVLFSALRITILVAKHNHKVSSFSEKYGVKGYDKLKKIPAYTEEREVFYEKLKRNLDELFSRDVVSQNNLLSSKIMKELKKSPLGDLKTVKSFKSETFTEEKTVFIVDNMCDWIASMDHSQSSAMVGSILKEVFKSLGFNQEMKGYFMSISMLVI